MSTPPEPAPPGHNAGSESGSAETAGPHKILFIAGSTSLKVGDQLLREHLMADGYQVYRPGNMGGGRFRMSDQSRRFVIGKEKHMSGFYMRHFVLPVVHLKSQKLPYFVAV